MRGEIVSVGTEMLLGMIADTNAQYLAQQLAEIGVDVFWISQIGDNLGRVVEVFSRGLSRSDVIVVTGGLGPTEDDLTREAIAETLGEKMEVQPELEQWLRDLFARRNRPMPERNLKQATLIPSAKAIPNPIGTAPGWHVETNGKLIIAMPGVPSEMHMMWEQYGRPVIMEKAGAGVLVTRSLKVLGLGEGLVEQQLGELIHSTNPTVATYAKPDGVLVRISAKATDETTARSLIAPIEAEAARLLDPYVWGHDDDTLAGLAAPLLKQRGWKLVTAEHGTGGALATEVSMSPDLLEHYHGGYLVSPNGAPLSSDSLDPALLATAARRQTGAEAAVAVVLSSRTGQPAAEFAVDVQDRVEADTSRWNLAIPELRRRSAVEATALLLRLLRESN
jgi:nicotinamide-nucleotide amidase